MESPRLTSVQSAAVMACKANLQAADCLGFVNHGLAELRATGE